jgi:Fic family protein
MSINKEHPYNDLPALPPGRDIETKDILKKAIKANKALAELKGVGDVIPNQSLLIDSIALQEAKDSSEIENVITTNDELYQAANDNLDKYSPNTKEVFHYKEALWHGLQAIKERPMSVPVIEQVCNRIKQNNAGIRKTPGAKLTDDQDNIVYTPPEGEQLIREKLDNMLHFLYGDNDVDPLIKMAITHYQFEAIHPFSDGNGRTGRIINILYLLETGLLDIPVLYLSRYIIKNKNQYYSALRNVTEANEWEAWILYMLDAVEITALETRKSILSIRQLLESTMLKVQKELPKVYSKELIELIFEQPYCKIKFLEQAGIAQRQTASTYLQQLEKLDIVTGIKIGREKLYLNTGLLDLLKGNRKRK